MVYITSEDGKEKKFACIKCIKGHRSSKCNHSNRELFEIKKKGRPVSQCDTCRQLRKTKQIHIKCMCHLDLKLKDALVDKTQVFRHSELSSIISNKPADVAQRSGACLHCDRHSLYCSCNAKHDVGYSSSSSDGSVTSPVYQMSSPSSSAGLNNNSDAMTNPVVLRHLTIPIHDPSDDIDSDTPIYKSHEAISDKDAVLGEFSNTSSEDLMNQIYSGFIDKNDEGLLLREADQQLAQLAEDV